MNDYDVQQSLLSAACTFSRTVARHVLSNPTFWLFFSLHLILWYSYRSGLLESYNLKALVEENGILFLNIDHLRYISAMTTFFAVFYTNQCYARYFQLYHDVNRVFVASHEICFSLKGLAVKPKTKNCMSHVRRHMQAALLLFFRQLKLDNLDDAWDLMIDMMVLTREEAQHLQSIPVFQVSGTLLDWMRRGVMLAYLNADPASSLRAPAMLNRCIEKLYEFEKVQTTVKLAVQMPVPFQYYQLLNTMVCINCVLWTYGMAMTTSLFGPVVYAFASFLLIGMLTMANMLADPFGEDDVDFPLLEWTVTHLENQVAWMQSDYSGDFEGVMFGPEIGRKEKRITAFFNPETRTQL
eukprot:TRINITY_DN23382_c0_g1_i1.p1 TRINITY_DN23382_c0_g1~~TRINITY_DN23382_c0_g1_i1.p1  ORF type:complete len:370 (+),score=37.72 TRINITY_DN23382_c0_g1_i1:52-1110(+)